MSIKTEDASEFLLATAEINGVACATVADGHVLIFKRAKLEEILRSVGDEEQQIVIFVKRPKMQG